MCLVFLLHEFDHEFKDMPGVEIIVADHLSRITPLESDDSPIDDMFPDEQLLVMWYANKLSDS